MMEKFCLIVSFITPIIVFLVPRYKITYELMRQISDMPLTMWNNIRCFIPIYNGYLCRKIMYGKATAYKIFSIYCAISFSLLMLARFAFPKNLLFNVIMVLVMYVTLILIYAFGLYMNINICNTFDCRNLILLCIVVPPLGIFMLDKRVRMFCKQNTDLINNTFGGDDDDSE